MIAQEHFTRVTPIVGSALRHMRVALIGLPSAAPLVAYLAACGVGRWLWAIDDVSTQGAETLRSDLHAQHGPALALDTRLLACDNWAATIQHDPPDLVIAVGTIREHALALEAATVGRVPALLITPPAGASPCAALIFFPDDDPQPTIPNLQPPTGEPTHWAWASAAPLCAGLARAILLRHTPFRRADLAALWHSGARELTIGTTSDAFEIEFSAIRQSRSSDPCEVECARPLQSAIFQTPPAPRGTLLIAGLGSLGSVAATHLVGWAHTLVLADPQRVDRYNPARQAYPLGAIGRSKAYALRDTLLAAGAGPVAAHAVALTDERAVTALIERHTITAALIATGTSADFALARALRDHDLPHVVGRCYPRARYWEAIFVDGRRGPSLSDLRGHMQRGPIPAPTPEQIATYSDAGALEAEPATLIESGWAAVWMARLAAQLLAPAGLRERWLLDLLATRQTCLIGGVGVEPTPHGPAYAITVPGQIRAWGQGAIRSATRID
jgi:hypothetical protein